jgi:hypothetical protein
VTLLYTGNTNRGKVDVYLDGTDAAHKIGTIDQYTSSVTYQKGWTSGNLGEGEHTIRFVHAGAAGKVVNIDALTVETYTPPPGAGTHDNLHSGWTFSSGFKIQSSTSAYEGGIHYATAVGQSAAFTFTGSQVTLLYTGNTNRGKVDVYLDGTDAAHKIGTINQYTSSVTYQKGWTSGNLGEGEHTIRFVHAGAAGKVVNIDALTVGTYVPPAPAGSGTHDDDHPGWVYNGTFSTQTNALAYDGSIQYTTTVGNYAEFTFTGSQVTLLYTGNTNRGKVDVYLDGTDAAHKIGTIDQYTSSVTYQKGWTSGNLGEGEHTIRFVHAGAAGKVINIDALTVGTYVPPAAVNPEINDDSPD